MEAILLNSGGIDSLAVAMIMKAQGHTIHSLYIDWGGAANRLAALPASELIAKEYCASHHVVTMEGIKPGGEPLDGGNGNHRGIPFQQAYFHLIAGQYARNLDVPYIISGHKGEYAKDDLLATITKMLKSSTVSKSIIPLRPLSNMKTFAEVYLIVKDSPILKQTVSCGQSSTKCGVCWKCKLRQEFGID